MNKYTNCLAVLASAPESQIDKTITLKLSNLAKDDCVKSEQIKEILDECAYASLASDFAMMALDVLWNQMLYDESNGENP